MCPVTTLDFGNLVIAESTSRALTIKNTGALDVSFHIEAVEPRDIETVALSSNQPPDDGNTQSEASLDSEIELHTHSQPALCGEMKAVSDPDLDSTITVGAVGDQQFMPSILHLKSMLVFY